MSYKCKLSLSHLEHGHEDCRSCITILKCSDELRQYLMATHIFRKVVQLGCDGTKETVLLSFFLDLDLLQKEQSIYQVILEVAPQLAAARDDVRRIWSGRWVCPHYLTVHCTQLLGDLQYNSVGIFQPLQTITFVGCSKCIQY